MIQKLFFSFILILGINALAIAEQSDTTSTPKVITLEQALQIALSENTAVKVADMEIERSGYARKGSYAALFPKIDGSATYQRTIKKQVMYMDFDMSSLTGGAAGSGTSGSASPSSPAVPSSGLSQQEFESAGDTKKSSGGGIEVGRWNTYSAGINASLPLVNVQLWESLKVSDTDVELAIEKARSSRLDMVNQVKQAYFTCLLSKEAFAVYKSVYDNALANLDKIQKRYDVQKASELDLTRAKTTLANAVPNVYDAESSVILSLWQLKAVMGVNLDENIDIAGTLSDYAQNLYCDIDAFSNLSLHDNSSLRQLALQAEQLASAVKIQQYSTLPSLALAFSYSLNAMTNDFDFSQYRWSPHSYLGLSLQIPIFAGGQRANSIKAARVQAAELSLQQQNTERQLKIAIRQYLNKMETASKSHNACMSALESATKAYNIASASYNVGRSTLTDLNDAQLALTQSQLAVSQAIYNFIIAKANLESTLGADFLTEDGSVTFDKTYYNE